MKKGLPLLVTAWLAGCSGRTSALDPRGPSARSIFHLTGIFAGTLSIVYVLVLIAAFWALYRAISKVGDLTPRSKPDQRLQRNHAVAVGIAGFFTVLILCGLVLASFLTDRTLLNIEQKKPVETVVLTGHQWWWEVQYLDPETDKIFTSANELHLPAGQPVEILLKSADVIHSLWLPNISGKRDIIPGRDTKIVITAEQVGTWTGRCSSFCGLQHANMQLPVIVQSSADFSAWREAQSHPAVTPASDEALHGQQVFMNGPCVMCHTIRGTGAGGTSAVAPDLTHLKSRAFLAAGTLPNTKGNLGGWVVDPQAIKPGVKMPVNLLPPEDLQALLTYLDSLK